MSFYQNSCRYAVQTFAQNMIDCADEFNAEIEIADNLESIDFIISNADNFHSVNELADAALASTLDTVVRELIYNTLHDYEA